MIQRAAHIHRWGAFEGALAHLAAPDAERRAHDDDDVPAAACGGAGSAAHVGRQG
jgi:hypothetical protein